MSTSPASRAVRWIVGLALAFVIVAAVMDSGDATPAAAPEPPPGSRQTEFGPLTPSDVDLLNKVRQAGLWEIPVGQQMQQRAVNDSVAEVGRRISTEHVELDRIVRQTADALGVNLPSQPSQQQQQWMTEVAAQTGPDYDRVAVNRLRLAHGKVLPLVSTVRSGTRNDRIRELATTTAEFVTRHHEYLESTGLVDFAALPEPPIPDSPGAPAAPPAAVPVPAAADTGAPPAAAGLWVTLRDAPVSSWLAALVAAAATLGASRMINLVGRRPASTEDPTGAPPSVDGSTARRPARSGYPALPGSPRPSAPAPHRGPPPPPGAAAPRWGGPRTRRRVPAGFSAALLVLLLLPPVADTAAAPPSLPGLSAAEAAGFAALHQAADVELVADEDKADDSEKDADDRRRQDENARQDDDGKRRQEQQDDGRDNAPEFPGRAEAAPPARDDFIDIADVAPQRSRMRSVSNTTPSGSFISDCGMPAAQLRNSDNWIVAPGKENGAQHMHDYVGNLSTDANTSEDDLVRSGTTCALGDRSTYFWPALRDTTRVGVDQNADGGGLDGNVGEILRPNQVIMQFMGGPAGPVEPMPPLLRAITGDAKATTNGDANANAQWTCQGFENRRTDKYPLCPDGSRLLRVLDFPNCWDGENLDSADHRSHITFPEEDSGACPDGTAAVPQLRMILAYDVPPGPNFALDGFPDQGHNPATDHADFTGVMPGQLMNAVVDCINSGRQC